MIRYRDLSGALKTIVVLSWITVGFYAASFVVGFILGLIGLW